MKCFRCGVCCAKYQVRLDEAKAERIAAALGISQEDFVRRFADPRWQGTESILVRQQDGKCAFLESRSDRESLCSIQNIKPPSCLEFTAGLEQKECREGLSHAWGLTVNQMGEIEGDPDKVKALLDFLESIPE